MRNLEGLTTGTLADQIAELSEALRKRPAAAIELSSDIDILEAAEAVIHQHGDKAPLFCARKMVDMLERGDLSRVATWLAIRHATRSLLDE